MIAHSLAKLGQYCAGLIRLLPNYYAVSLYSRGRLKFMQFYAKHKVKEEYLADSSWHRTMWGLHFNAPLMNSAGMFKNGEAYDLVAKMGAGAYIGGTSTYNQREGNDVSGVKLPFLTLPNSHTSVNFLGLPNLGDKFLSKKNLVEDRKICPLGWSVMRSPDFAEDAGLEHLVESLWLYHANPQIDFIEINESCPNIKIDSSNINARLEYIAHKFLSKRKRHLPVVVKLSSDIDSDVMCSIMHTLFEYKYDGINIGNTSTDYTQVKQYIASSEQKQFDYFTNKFGGGVGGSSLKVKTYNLCKRAVEYRDFIKPGYEFHVIRCGGIDSIADIYDSDKIGVSMNQWYTGYFASYIEYGDKVYQRFFTR